MLATGALPYTCAGAAIFKCQGDGGVPTYQEFPCAAGKELRNFERDPPPLTIIPGEASSIGTAARAPGARGDKPASSRSPGKSQERTAKKPRGDPRERRYAHAGMTEAEVLTKLGRPDVTAVGARKGRGRWSYLPAPGDPDTITTLQLDKGVVVDVERKTVKR